MPLMWTTNHTLHGQYKRSSGLVISMSLMWTTNHTLHGQYKPSSGLVTSVSLTLHVKFWAGYLTDCECLGKSELTSVHGTTWKTNTIHGTSPNMRPVRTLETNNNTRHTTATDKSLFSHSVLLALSLRFWSFPLHISLRKNPSALI